MVINLIYCKDMSIKQTQNIKNSSFWIRAIDMYVDGFRSMTVGRTLWMIIFIKLFIMFAILRAIFFPNFLSSQFDTDSEKSRYVGNELIKRAE